MQNNKNIRFLLKVLEMAKRMEFELVHLLLATPPDRQFRRVGN